MVTLVIGGAGYIGSHTAHALRRRGHEVIIYDNHSTGCRALARGFELIVGGIGLGETGTSSSPHRRRPALRGLCLCRRVGGRPPQIL